MSGEFRCVGEIGKENTTVMTEWMDVTQDGVKTGIKMGLNVRGWRNIRVEER